MRSLSRRVLAVLTALALTSGGVTSAHAGPGDDIADRLKAIPGMKVEERTSTLAGYRWFWMTYRQPVDHRNPGRGWFEQRVLLEHKATDRPMVLYTSGYNTPEVMFRSEPMALVDGNQISVEYRYFTPSRPEPTDWSKDNIWQAATDEHKLIKALKPIYDQKWISTGASKGGMTATYHKRFYPDDVDGSVVYVAPNDVNNWEDSAYDRFLNTVGTDNTCRDHLRSLQREFLKRRPAMLTRIKAAADAAGATFNQMRSVDIAFENSVMDFEWVFWQYSLESTCAGLPVAATATDDELYQVFDEQAGALTYTDQGLAPYVPYYYQAGTELGWPAPKFTHLRPLLRYENTYKPRTYVPREIPMLFKPFAMDDIDHWVKTRANHMLFLYGENDPWGAEPFKLGSGSRDSAVYTAPGWFHSGRLIAQLVPEQKAAATADLLRWANVPQTVAPQAKVAADEDPILLQRPPL